ncbi:MAG TPA: hypothetical protein DIC19_02710 [Erysipelotrichaceae bacterium]|nr:hypothetical protein [Erysipelotrichaceae bacterium]
MGADEKLMIRIFGRKVPNDITFKELSRFLINIGFILQTHKGAHYNFKHPNLVYILTIDSHDERKPVNKVYINKVKEALEELGINGEEK